MDDWDVVAPTEVAPKQLNSNLGLDKASFLGSLTGAVTAHVGKTVSQMSKAMGKLLCIVLLHVSLWLLAHMHH